MNYMGEFNVKTFIYVVKLDFKTNFKHHVIFKVLMFNLGLLFLRVIQRYYLTVI